MSEREGRTAIYWPFPDDEVPEGWPAEVVSADDFRRCEAERDAARADLARLEALLESDEGIERAAEALWDEAEQHEVELTNTGCYDSRPNSYRAKPWSGAIEYERAEYLNRARITLAAILREFHDERKP